jgi:hypothetical protein
MKRRQFFAWMGKASAAIGLGYLTARSGDLAFETPMEVSADRRSSRPRLNGSACHDYRVISFDSSIILDRDAFIS